MYFAWCLLGVITKTDMMVVTSKETEFDVCVKRLDIPHDIIQQTKV